MNSRRVAFLWVLLASQATAIADPAADAARKQAADMVKKAGMAPIGRFVTFTFAAKDFAVSRDAVLGSSKTLTFTGNASLQIAPNLQEGFKIAVGPLDRTGFQLRLHYKDLDQYNVMGAECVQMGVALAAQPPGSTRKLRVEMSVREPDNVIYLLQKNPGGPGNSVYMSDDMAQRPAWQAPLPFALNCSLVP